MIKRVYEFVEFINNFDPKAVVVIQGGYNTPLFEVTTKRKNHKIFTLVKVPKSCEENLSNKINNINAIRLLLSCATNQEPDLIKF